MNNMMRKIPGAPELAGPWMPRKYSILDAIAIYRARFVGRSVIDNLRPFIDAKNWNWRGISVPDSNSQAIAARGFFEDQISLAPGSFLLAVSGVSDQPEGFRWLLTDKGTKQTLSSDYNRHLAANGGLGSKYPTRPLPFYLPSPWAISDAGLLVVQLSNLSSAVNNINLLFQFAEPA